MIKKLDGEREREKERERERERDSSKVNIMQLPGARLSAHVKLN